jgi:hypothetical protein
MGGHSSRHREFFLSDQRRGFFDGNGVLFKSDPTVIVKIEGCDYPIPRENIDLNTGIVQIPMEILRRHTRTNLNTLLEAMTNAHVAEETAVSNPRRQKRKQSEKEKALKAKPTQNYLKLSKKRF